VFFLLVKLQKHLPLAKRLKWTDGRSPEAMRAGLTNMGAVAAELDTARH
jgi:hypothetical protein